VYNRSDTIYIESSLEMDKCGVTIMGAKKSLAK